MRVKAWGPFGPVSYACSEPHPNTRQFTSPHSMWCVLYSKVHEHGLKERQTDRMGTGWCGVKEVHARPTAREANCQWGGITGQWHGGSAGKGTTGGRVRGGRVGG